MVNHVQQNGAVSKVTDTASYDVRLIVLDVWVYGDEMYWSGGMTCTGL